MKSLVAAGTLAVVGAFVFAPVGHAQNRSEAPLRPASADAEFACPPAEEGPGRPLAAVRYLADDALEGRFSGSPAERCAGDYIADRFASLGLEPAGEDGWFQSLPLASAARPHAPSGIGRNVLGVLRGSDPEAGVVVVGAHYDHLGYGEFGSTGESGRIHNGADDNASGVAAMIEAARRLVEGPRPERSILFIAFTGEELGLIGSSHYAKNPTIPLERTIAMINLDMVGRLGDGELIVYGTGTAPEWADILPAANAGLDLPLVYEEAGFGPSDHTSFYASGVPVLHLFTNVHGDYHRETDDWEKIDADGLTRIARFTARLAGELAGRPGRLTLIPGVGEREQRAEGYGAWLGTVPDFTPVERGVLLAGVSAGSPAEEVDLRKGDVVVGVGEHEVEDLYGLTDALRAHRPGDEVVVRYLRDGIERSVTLTLGDRSERPR